MVRVLIRTALLSPDQLPMPVSITSAPSSSEPLTARHPGAVQAGLVLVVSGTAFVLATIGGLVVLGVGIMALMHFGMVGGMSCC